MPLLTGSDHIQALQKEVQGEERSPGSAQPPVLTHPLPWQPMPWLVPHSVCPPQERWYHCSCCIVAVLPFSQQGGRSGTPHQC